MKATTVRGVSSNVDTTGDPISFLSPRRELRGFGAAMVIELPAPWVDHISLVADALATIDTSSELGEHPGTGPVAFGALPFNRNAPARFIVPAVVTGHDELSTTWTTQFSDLPVDPQPILESYVEGVSFGVSPTISADHWCEMVAEATSRIADGQLQKVVLAREIVVHSPTVIDPHVIAERLSALHPHALRFDIDSFVGASPELLVSRFGDVVRSQPMAGTTPRTGDPAIDSAAAETLLASPKNRWEHQVTIDMVLDTLLSFTSFVDAEPTPSVVDAGPVQHLATMVAGHLSEPPASVLELVAALHPTPAVGGYPRAEGLALIDELEPTERGRYAGPVGWVDAWGNGVFAVGLRSATISGSTAHLFAGVGVVEDSDPQAELAETNAKFAATLGAFKLPEEVI